MNSVLRYPTSAPPSAPFGFVPADSALRATLDDLLAGWDQELADLPPGPLEIVSELRGRRTPTGWTLDRVCTSLQVGLGDAGTSFAATTLHWQAGDGPPQWAEFPDDPYLDGLGPAVAAAPAVLRYVPQRRCTFRTDGTVVKVERRSRLHDSFTRAVAFTAAASGSPVAVPRLGRLYQAASAYTQDDVPGASLAELATGRGLEPLLAEAGALSAEIHRLDAPDLPLGLDPAAVAAAACASADWAAAFTAPALADVLRRQRDRLAAGTVAPAARTTCHGDLVPRHLIGGPGEWTVIDLDLAHRGDPYRDLASFLTALPGGVRAPGHDAAGPLRRRAAEEAYLGGYEERSGRRLDRRRLAWHRAAAELQVLGRTAAEDRWRPTGLAGAVTRVGHLLEQAA